MEMEKLFSVLLFSSLPERLLRFMRENGGKIRKGTKKSPKLAEIELSHGYASVHGRTRRD